jgi:hypothetical protein
MNFALSAFSEVHNSLCMKGTVLTYPLTAPPLRVSNPSGVGSRLDPKDTGSWRRFQRPFPHPPLLPASTWITTPSKVRRAVIIVPTRPTNACSRGVHLSVPPEPAIEGSEIGADVSPAFLRRRAFPIFALNTKNRAADTEATKPVNQNLVTRIHVRTRTRG